MATTYFIRTPLPLSDVNRAFFAERHREGTGNQLSVLNNGAGTECLVKVTTNRTLPELYPDGFTPTEVIEGVENARAVLNSVEWTATPV